MSVTRPSGSSVVPDDGASVVQEVAAIDPRGRFTILPRWLVRVEWLAGATEIEALLELSEPGRVKLKPLETAGPMIVQMHADLVAQLPDADAREALRLLQDRFRKLPIPKDRRPHLGDAALAHLGLSLSRKESKTVYVAVFTDSIDILSPAYRNEKLLEGSPLLDSFLAELGS
jgi:hypothetical protein